jgi:FkbM family methyltransferase
VELEALLRETEDEAAHRAATAFDRLVEPFGQSLVLFGAGNLGRRIAVTLRETGVEPLAFADNNPALWGRRVAGLEVLSPAQAAARHGATAAFLVTIWSPGSGHRYCDTRRKLRGLGCVKVVSFLPFLWKHAAQYLPDCFLDLPQRILPHRDEILALGRLWEDEESRRTYLTQLQWRFQDDYDGLPPRLQGPQYFPEGLFAPIPGEVFVDCGAYDGDTVKTFLAWARGDFEAIHAFEPDRLNFEKLTAHRDTLPEPGKVVLHQAAVGGAFEKLRFSDTGTASSVTTRDGAFEVDSVPLDGVLGGVRATFLKMDIEGAEEEALRGARELIQRNLPILAICTYHRQDHLWKLPLLIKALAPEYRLFLRAHQEEGWDVVCYAVPPNRLLRPSAAP